ncbi:MAG: hypothetical protein WBC33_07745 [Conexibacter sp.]
MVYTPLDDLPPFDKAPVLPDELFIPDIWGPLPYLRRKRAEWRARRERRRLRRFDRRRIETRRH